MTNRVPNSSQQPPSQSDGHHSYNAQEERSVRESARGKTTEGCDNTDQSVSSRRSAVSETQLQNSSQTSQHDSSTVTSTSSAMDDGSVADASYCPSPTKKKPRSSPVTEETTAEQEDDSYAREVARVRTPRSHSPVNTNLVTRFDNSVDQVPTTPPRLSQSPQSQETPATVGTDHHTQEAPLSPQYKSTCPDGASPT